VSVIAIYLKDPMRAHAHLLEMDGRVEEARAAYATAARLATSIPEQRYLNTRAAQRAPV
jgi:predicted RNA polymerase sigma factor